MKVWVKLRAGALQLVLFIGIILFLLISSLIVVHHFGKLNQIDFLLTKEAQVKNMESCQNIKALTNNDFTFLDEEGTIEKSYVHYGCFQVLTSKTILSNKQVVNYAFVGGQPSNTSLVLENHQFGLSISGKTRIEGNIQLPKEGIKAGFVNGKYYYGSTLHYYGDVSLSKEKIGEPNNVSELKSFLKKGGNQNYLTELKIGEVYHNSFANATKTYYSSGSIDLKQVKLSGNFIIKSKKEIHVYKTSVLEDVVLIAPHIVIHEKTEGAFQAIAEESIVVEKDVDLRYPSALVVNDTGKEGSVELLENVKFSGVMMYLKKRDEDFRSLNLTINKGVNITGEVFCQGGLSIADAEIKGSVWSKYFIHKTLGSTYINMLMNTRVSNLGIYKQFSGFNWDDNYKVMKWLY